MSLNCETALQCLKTTPLDLEELRSCLMDAIDDGNRANDIIAGIRGLFKTTARPRTMTEINGLVREVLGMIENALHAMPVVAESCST